jgi:hypothetical protein
MCHGQIILTISDEIRIYTLQGVKMVGIASSSLLMLNSPTGAYIPTLTQLPISMDSERRNDPLFLSNIK